MKNEKTFEQLNQIVHLFSVPIYWLDLEQKFLGVNAAVIKITGTQSFEQDFLNKTLFDLYPVEMAKNIIEHHKEVAFSGKSLMVEESIKDRLTGEIKHFHANIAPLYGDDKNSIIGTICISLDITIEKQEASRLDKERIFEHLKMIAPIIPVSMYWLDLNNRVLGINQRTVDAIGGLKVEDFIGRTPYEFYPKEVADGIVQHLNEVLELEKTMSYEETITDITTGEIKHFNAIISPLRDNNDNIIGTIGATADVSAEKEKDKFLKIAQQLAHDIRSPLASLLMIVKSCTEIPEADRIALREAAIEIGDITNNLLTKYQKKDPEAMTEEEKRQPMLVSAVLLQIITDKKYQYHNLPIKLDYDFAQDSQISFIKMVPSAFKRTISNLINNAVDALSNHAQGKVIITLSASAEWVYVSIKDNGKGMPQELIEKIMHHVSVTAGKKDGHGIGLVQVQDTLQQNQGELSITSQENAGTTIVLTFPRIQAPHWIAEEIKLGTQDIVVILDDDTSIHSAWDSIFEKVLKIAPCIQLKHFQMGNEALKYIQSLSNEDKKKIFLLTDYELLKQNLNGLQVVEKSHVQHSVLVTSHYADPVVRDHAAKTGTRILPKQLASEIPIRVDKTVQYQTSDKVVNLVIVDDDESFVENLKLFAWPDKQVDQYHDPRHFLENLNLYSKETCIVLDNQFGSGGMSGIEVAHKIHEKGYSCIYLLSGETFHQGELADFIRVINKNDIDGIMKLG